MKVKHERNNQYVIIDIGKEYKGYCIYTINNDNRKIFVTLVSSDGKVTIFENIFNSMKNKLFIKDELLEFDIL